MTTLKEKMGLAVLQILEFVAVLCIILFALIVVSCSPSLLFDCYAQIYVFLFSITIIADVRLMIETVIRPEDEENSSVYVNLLLGFTNILMACNGIWFVISSTGMLTSNTCDGGLIYASIITSLMWFVRFAFFPFMFILPLVLVYFCVSRNKDAEVIEKNSLKESLI